MKRVVMTCAVLLSLSVPGFAAQTPTYDIKTFCKEVGGGSAVIELQCRKDEERAMATVQAANVPANTMAVCNEIAAFGGMGSYIILEQCIKDELSAAAQLE